MNYEYKYFKYKQKFFELIMSNDKLREPIAQTLHPKNKYKVLSPDDVYYIRTTIENAWTAAKK